MKTATFSLIIAICVAILSIFQFIKYQTFILNAQTNLKKLEDKINQKLEVSDKTLLTLKEQEQAILTQMQDPTLKNATADLKKLENNVSLKIEEFNNDIIALKEQEHAVLNRIQNPTWKMAEVEYLFYLASIRLQGIPNLKLAIDLLTTAQEKIKDLNDPNLTPLAQALTKDLKALNQVSPPNTDELWLKISMIIEKTTKLSPRSVEFNEEKKETIIHSNAKNTAENADNWKQKILNSLKEVKDLVKIQQNTKPIEPLLTEAQQGMVTTNLRLLLEQIRFAILTEDQTIYQHAIQNAEQLLTTYYNEADPNVKNVQNELTELAKNNLRPQLPKMASFELFNRLRQ